MPGSYGGLLFVPRIFLLLPIMEVNFLQTLQEEDVLIEAQKVVTEILKRKDYKSYNCTSSHCSISIISIFPHLSETQTGPVEGICVQHPQGHLELLSRIVSSWILILSRNGDTTTSPGNPCLCLVTHTVKVQKGLPVLHFVPLALPLGTIKKSLAPFTLHASFSYLQTLIRAP